LARIGPERHRSDVAEPNAVVDIEVLEILDRRHIGRGAHDDVLRVCGQRAGRHVVGHAGKRIAQIGDRQTERGETRLVDIDAEDFLRSP
jgi:hypothetical protein